MKTVPQQSVPKLIETTPIRLTHDETRLVLEVATAGCPIRIQRSGHLASGLTDIGIFARTEVPEEKETAARVAECWKEAREGMRVKDVDIVHQAMHSIERLQSDRHREQNSYLYSLTELGKQVARGVGVRLNGRKR